MSTETSSLGVPGKTIVNWVGSCSCVPELYCEPETTEDIRKIVDAARSSGKTVRVIGSGYSYNDYAMTNDFLVSLRKYNKVLHVDHENHTVRVQGGVTLKTLNETALPEHGLALSVQGIEPDVSLAGAITTGTHGTGARFGSLSSMVKEIELITSTGDILLISSEKNADLLPAASLSLGVLGVILSVTLQCEPAFRLRKTVYPANYKQVLENLSVHVNASDHFQFFWLPYTDHVICEHATRTKEDLRPMKLSIFWHIFVGAILFETLHWLSAFSQRLLPWIYWLYFHLLFKHRTDIVDRSDKVFAMKVGASSASEWAIPRDNAALVFTELKTWTEENGVPAHFPVVFRFSKRDDIYLSPACDTDVCYVNAVFYKPFGKNIDKERYYAGLTKIVTEAGGRPHWGKEWNLDASTISDMYPRWQTFCQIRSKLDPSGMFLNDSLSALFGKT